MSSAALAVPFHRPAAQRAEALQSFNGRAEILWFGFEGAFEAAQAVIRPTRLPPGMLGGSMAASSPPASTRRWCWRGLGITKPIRW
jgi:hypothetical protein